MFTGLIEEIGTYEGHQGDRYRIGASLVLEDAKIGDSISVNGSCLTVVALGPDWWEAEVTARNARQDDSWALCDPVTR